MKHRDDSRVSEARAESQQAWDLVVVGAGGAGLSAALFAALEGARVLVLESTEWVGGTTAWSAGTTWVPGTHHAAKVNASDTLAEAEKYLNHAVGEQAPAALREAFLNNGAEAVARIEAQSSMKYRPCLLYTSDAADE